MQYARYEAAAADPEEEARRLVCDGFLTQQQGASLDFAKIRRFFSVLVIAMCPPYLRVFFRRMVCTLPSRESMILVVTGSS